MTDSDSELRRSLSETFKSLKVIALNAYNLAPIAIITLTILFSGLIWATLYSNTLMTGTAALLVFTVSIGIFAARQNFGEGLLSLVAGLFTVFAFDFTVATYIGFTASWIAFSGSALIIFSIKLAAQSEDIYRQAALRLAEGGDTEVIEKRLEEIGSQSNTSMLGPIERAEIIRLLAFRNLPIDLFPSAIVAIGSLSIITKVDAKTITFFVVDAFLAFQVKSSSDGKLLVDTLYSSIRGTPVPPEDFFTAFAASRRLLLTQSINPEDFFLHLKEALTIGVAPSEMFEAIQEKI